MYSLIYWFQCRVWISTIHLNLSTLTSESNLWFLDLGHCWRTSTNATATDRRHATAGSKKDDNQRSDEGREQEPEESCASLEFFAALGWVVGACCERIFCGVRSVITVVSSELSSQNNTSNECKENRQTISDKEADRNQEGLHESGRQAVEEDKPAEDGNEHGIVDSSWVAAESISDDIAD